MGKPIYVDLTQYDSGKPHWLSPQGRRPDIANRVREKYRKQHQAERAVAATLKRLDQVKDRAK